MLDAQMVSLSHVFILACLTSLGTLLRDLQKQLSPSAQLVGGDVMRNFIPSSPQGNINYTYFDICEPPVDELKEAFDLSHVRLVLGGSGKVGIDAAVANVAGKSTYYPLEPPCLI